MALRPDNILLRTVNTTSDVVVRDFGSCRVRGFYDGFKVRALWCGRRGTTSPKARFFFY